MPGSNILGDCSAQIISARIQTIGVSVSGHIDVQGTCVPISPTECDYTVNYSYVDNASFGGTWNRESVPCPAPEPTGDFVFHLCEICCPFTILGTRTSAEENTGDWACHADYSWDPPNCVPIDDHDSDGELSINVVARISLVLSGDKYQVHVDANVIGIDDLNGCTISFAHAGFVSLIPQSLYQAGFNGLITPELNWLEVFGTHVFEIEDYHIPPPGTCADTATTNESLLTIEVTISE